MIRRVLAPVLLLAASATTAAAQTARSAITSAPGDTIYGLAVDPAQYPEERAVFLLDDGVVRFEADGRSSRTFRQVVQILRPEAVDDYREFRFSYSPGHEKLTVNWIRVIGADGRIINAEPAFVQDSDVPARLGDPVYSDQRVRRASITGVEPGTIVDFSYTTEELKPFLPGDFQQQWGVTTALAVQRSRFVVDVPASLELRIDEENLNFERRTVTAKGRTVHTWATANLPRIKGEPYAADSNGVWMSLTVSSPTTWQGIGGWYAKNARDRYRLTPEVERKLAEAVAVAATRDDSIRAVHRWVAQDIRYVSIALGMGGYQPRPPEEVLRTGFGDCKDKTTLLITALRRMGIEAYPALLNSTGGVERALPSLYQLNHVIVAIVDQDGYRFVDPTSSLTPFGELPPSEQGEFALVVRSESEVEEVTLPENPVDANVKLQRLYGTVSGNGTFTGWYEEAATGTLQYEMRELFENPVDPVTQEKFAAALARGFYPTATGDSLELFDGKDLGAPVKIRVHLDGGRATRSSGRTQILELPFGGMDGWATTAAELTERHQRDGRRFPIDARQVSGDNVLHQELRLTLPEGWRARLPESITAPSVFGTYRIDYAQNGRELTMTRRFAGARGIYAPERIGELIEWAGAIGRDEATFIIIDME